MLPLEVSFLLYLTKIDNIFDWINFWISCVFFIDILLQFRTTYVCSQTGIEIKDPKKIANHYLMNNFFIDFISTVHLDKLFTSNQQVADVE